MSIHVSASWKPKPCTCTTRYVGLVCLDCDGTFDDDALRARAEAAEAERDAAKKALFMAGRALIPERDELRAEVERLRGRIEEIVDERDEARMACGGIVARLLPKGDGYVVDGMMSPKLYERARAAAVGQRSAHPSADQEK